MNQGIRLTITSSSNFLSVKICDNGTIEFIKNVFHWWPSKIQGLIQNLFNARKTVTQTTVPGIADEMNFDWESAYLTTILKINHPDQRKKANYCFDASTKLDKFLANKLCFDSIGRIYSCEGCWYLSKSWEIIKNSRMNDKFLLSICWMQCT